MSKFDDLFKQYNCNFNDITVQEEVAKIILENFTNNDNKEVYHKCLSLIDLTSLNSTDTEAEIVAMVNKVNEFKTRFPQLPNVAAICVYPALVPIVKEQLTETVGIASVSAGFPASQTFIEIKVAETAMAVMEGATEIDVVLPIGKFLEGKYQDIYEELSEIKATCRQAHLKVILETGALLSSSNIKKASILAMASGADFIKTSTGKMPVAATLEASFVMCEAIKEWQEATGEKVGFKAAGGIVTTEDAVKYYSVVNAVLGQNWLNSSLFRIGASRLANNLITSIEQKDVKWF
jgi:deoxyribose-phosphate aldolase